MVINDEKGKSREDFLELKIVYEGLEKATRGGEWEPIKIPRRNLTSIPNRTRYPSLLTRPGPHSYRIAIGPRNQVRERNHIGRTNWCKESQAKS